MGLFTKKKKEVKEEKKEEVIEKKASSDKTGEKKIIAPLKTNSLLAFEVLIEPWITEKASEKMAENKYIFKVARYADKKKTKRAIEELYGVTVIKVNIINIPSKRRNFGARTGWKSGFKKAIITLKDGDKIELFEGV